MSDTRDRERDEGATGPEGDVRPEAPDARPDAPSDEAERVSDFPPDDALDFPEELDEVDVRDLLRGALRPPAGSVAPSLLRGVQQKLRVRSRGKFYGDGWSTASSPRSTYLVTSLVMLGLVLIVFLVLIPWSAGALP